MGLSGGIRFQKQEHLPEATDEGVPDGDAIQYTIGYFRDGDMLMFNVTNRTASAELQTLLEDWFDAIDAIDDSDCVMPEGEIQVSLNYSTFERLNHL